MIPQLAGARKAVHLLGTVEIPYLVAGVLLEIAALLAYARLTRAVLPPGSPSFFTLLRIDLSTLSVSHILPGGTAAGTGLGYRLLTEENVRGTDAAFAVSTQGIGSALVLNVILWLALVIIVPLRGFNPLYGTAAIVGVLLLASFAFLVYFLTRGEEHATRILRAIARRVPLLTEDAVTRTFHSLADRLRELGSDRKLLLRAGGWAAANWLLDAASLWVFLGAFGHFISPIALLVCYSLANVLAALPITPGGLGVVEGVLIPTLAGFGLPRGVAILGVISYRLVNFWLPIPVGGLAYLSLRVEPGSSRQQKAKELKRLAARATRASEGSQGTSQNLVAATGRSRSPDAC